MYGRKIYSQHGCLQSKESVSSAELSQDSGSDKMYTIVIAKVEDVEKMANTC